MTMTPMRSALLAATLLFAGPSFAADPQAPAPATAAQRVKFDTSLGSFTITLDAGRAPKTVENFLRYAHEGHFEGTVVYRIEPDFVIQMGSYDSGGGMKATHDPIPLESANGLKNVRGAVSMARSSNPNSATSEFFVDLADNAPLDPMPGARPNTTGYAVFGAVTEGMDTVDKIAASQTGGAHGPFPPASTPFIPVTINKVTVE
jgi:peptidyl-prolyl cis-trans isomerase A (cyclophilin A)